MTRFYLLGDPWIDSRDRGKTTAILFGSPDPHIAVHLADTTCITGCLRCEEDAQVHRRDAEWLVNVLNTFGEWPPAIQPSAKKGRSAPCTYDPTCGIRHEPGDVGGPLGIEAGGKSQ